MKVLASHLALVLLLLTLGLAGCKRSDPANVAATVNNRPITNAQLEKQFQVQFSGPAGRPDDDEASLKKLEVLRGLVDAEIMLQRAEKAGLLAVESDVEGKFNQLKAPYTQEDFQKQLQSRKITVEELKAQLRRDLSVEKLFNKEITSKIAISDKDVAAFYNANKAAFNLAEPQIHMAQILVTPAPDPSVQNLKKDKAQNDEQARQKILMLEARVRQGEEFGMVAQNFSEDPQSASNGGDLGFIPASTLDKANPELRKLVMAMSPGQVSGVIRTPEGYRLLKVISKEPAGQRELTDPRVQQNIRETLINRREQLLRAAYYEVARNEATLKNYFAASIVTR